MGRGRLCHAELRPLAYSMLAELVHHIRADLSYPQLSRVVYLFCRRARALCAHLMLGITLLHWQVALAMVDACHLS